MVSKRKREQLDESDSDEPSPGRQVLPVASLPKDFAGDPADGMEYLFLVRRDALRLPRITRVHNPYERPTIPALQNASVCDLLPCEQWRTIFEAHFRNFRKNTCQSTTGLSNDQGEVTIPEKKDREGWWKFLAGYPESEWSAAFRTSQQKAKSSQQMRAFPDSPNTESQESVIVNPNAGVLVPAASREVTPSQLRTIDHRMAMHLLMYFTHWIHMYLRNRSDPSMAITISHARWMFALLTKVDSMVSANEMSLLRNLARACLEIIKTCQDSDMNISCAETVERMSDASCWMIIAAVADYWGQKDIWDDAKADLS